MKIISLTSENIKRLVAIEIKPDGNLVQITGRNGQGKTSVLDSLWWALAGAKNVQAAPIRRGANTARIKLDMGEIVVTRTFQRGKEGEGYTAKLEVVGNVKGSPQAMLDSLLDSLAFDPLEFARMPPKQQVEVLKRHVPGLDFDKLAAESSIDFSNRAEKNRKAKELRTQANAILITDKTPSQRVDESALVSELAKAGKHNQEIALRQENRKQVALDAQRHRDEAKRAHKLADELRVQADVAEKDAEALEAMALDFETKLAQAGPLPQSIDVEVLTRQIAEAKGINELVARRERKSVLEQQAIAVEQEAKQLTTRMELRESQKRDAIAKAKLPVEGMTFDEDTILLNGIPFDQASDAERLRISCAIAMAGNPQLRVIRVRDGSLLDEDSLKLLAAMCDEKDWQCWIEVVGPGKTGFIVEDGQLLQREAEESELPEVAR